MARHRTHSIAFKRLVAHDYVAGEITYVAIAAGFVYVAVVLDAESRRVVGYAIGRSIDARPRLQP